MKKTLLILVLIGIAQDAFSQVGINTTSPNAQLDIKSSNQLTPSNTDGILIPKIDAFPVTNPTAAQNSMMVYLTTVSAGKQPGFYYWENATTSWKGFGSVPDADFYEVATTNPPDAITDAMFHTGNVGVGNVNPVYKLDVEETSNLKNSVINARHTNPASSTAVIKTTVSSGALTTGTLTSNENNIVLTNSVKGNGILNTISGTGTGLTNGISNIFSSASTGQNGIFNSFTGAPTGVSIGLNNAIEDNGNGDKMGVLDSITNGGNGRHFGIKNAFKGDGSGPRFGVYSKFVGSGNGGVWGSYNEFNRDGNGNIIGSENLIASDGDGQHYGMQNYISGSGIGLQTGVENYIGVYNTSMDPQTGTSNYITGNTSGVQTGTYNRMLGAGIGVKYGTYNYIFAAGTGEKYGSYSYIHPSTVGQQYGVYSDVTNGAGYAGYFLGRFSIGTTLTNNYILPLSRGTAGQIMQTDGAGNVTWQVNSAIDADFYEVGGTLPPNAITDNMYHTGNVTIGTNTNDNRFKLYTTTVQQTANGSGQSTIYGYRDRDSQNDGSGYAHTTTNSAIKGYNYQGDVYTFGVSGFCYNDFTRTGGVLGSYYNGGYWGSLGYKSSAATSYGVYASAAGYSTPAAGKMSSSQTEHTIGGGFYGGAIGSWSKGNLIGQMSSGNLFASYNSGDEYTFGKQIELVDTGNSKTAAYTVTSTEIVIYKKGKIALQNGTAHVAFDADYARLLGDDPIVTTTPMGQCNGIYIELVDKKGFTIKELNNGKSNVQISWIAVGNRADAANQASSLVLDNHFDTNINEVMFNENNLQGKGKAIWSDGNRINFGTMPQNLIDKPEKNENK